MKCTKPIRLASIIPAFFAVACALSAATAADYSPEDDPALEEIIPDGVTPDTGQRAVVLEAVPQVYLCRVEYNPGGKVRAIYLSNHKVKSNRKQVLAAYGEERAGIDAATLARFAAFGDLEEIILLHQNPAAEGFAALDDWPDLISFRIENIDHADFMPEINALQKLRWLELKHLFGLDETRVDELGTFPFLERLELDNASAQEEALVFLARNPTVRDFELHRSGLGNEEIGRIVDSLPNLERLALKPGGRDPFDAGTLAHVKRLRNLKIFGFHQWKPEMYVWEGGVEHLAEIPSLRFIEIAARHDPAVIGKLLEARPDIQIASGKNDLILADGWSIEGKRP
ncbi:MAG: hypothetical protein ACOC4K_00515 [Verrucomicrobiota bacterium]